MLYLYILLGITWYVAGYLGSLRAFKYITLFFLSYERPFSYRQGLKKPKLDKTDRTVAAFTALAGPLIFLIDAFLRRKLLKKP